MPELLRLEREERRLWRVALQFLALLAVAFAASNWERLRNLPVRLEAIPVGAAVLAVLFAIYVEAKRRQIAELRGVMRGMQQSSAAAPQEEQFTRLLEAISNSQRNYRQMIDSLEDIVMSVALDGTVQTLNRAAAQVFGKSFHDIYEHNLGEFLVEPGAAEMQRHLERFLARRHWSGVLKLRLRDSGAVRFVDVVAHPILSADDRVAAVSVLARDITEQREREALYTDLFETLQEAVYFTTPDGRILDCNNALPRMLGYASKEELQAINVNDLYVERATRLAEMSELQDKLAIRNLEIVLRAKDGRLVTCLDSSRIIFDSQGKPLRYQGTLIDITERRDLQRRLQEQEEFRRRLVDSFPDLIVALDRQGRFSFVSPRVREVLGYNAEYLVGRRFDASNAPAHGAEFKQLFDSLMSGKETYVSLEFAWQHADGSWKTMRATASPICDARGDLSGVVASLRDVTTLKQLEQQLIQSERLAGMGQMIDGFAHELNNPLTAILGALELLKDAQHGEVVEKRLELVRQQARRAAEVVQNLLFFSRPPQPGKAPLNLNDLIQRTLALHEHSLRVSAVAVDFVADPTSPQVIGDANQLMQVFLNLVINAEQAIREVRPRGTLSVRVGENRDRVWVSFQDDGPGIPSEMVPKIFDPFFTTKRPGRGTGLGLSVSVAILKKYGGQIEYQPAPGGGSIFVVSLPASKMEKVHAAAAVDAPPASTRIQ
ncbi:MAG TPA: PAS domain S-box protein [Terriglobales bacterium]|nr:PAS domain S-box protein [Terriglobales bacterium]